MPVPLPPPAKSNMVPLAIETVPVLLKMSGIPTVPLRTLNVPLLMKLPDPLWLNDSLLLSFQVAPASLMIDAVPNKAIA
jgi:hypothetical protein